MISATSPGAMLGYESTSTLVPWSSAITSMNRRSAGVIVPLLATTLPSAHSAYGVSFSSIEDHARRWSGRSGR